jgi:hypothetical protein
MMRVHYEMCVSIEDLKKEAIKDSYNHRFETTLRDNN